MQGVFSGCQNPVVQLARQRFWIWRFPIGLAIHSPAICAPDARIHAGSAANKTPLAGSNPIDPAMTTCICQRNQNVARV
jgi:hypothetical protein